MCRLPRDQTDEEKIDILISEDVARDPKILEHVTDFAASIYIDTERYYYPMHDDCPYVGETLKRRKRNIERIRKMIKEGYEISKLSFKNIVAISGDSGLFQECLKRGYYYQLDLSDFYSSNRKCLCICPPIDLDYFKIAFDTRSSGLFRYNRLFVTYSGDDHEVDFHVNDLMKFGFSYHPSLRLIYPEILIWEKICGVTEYFDEDKSCEMRHLKMTVPVLEESVVKIQKLFRKKRKSSA